MKLEGKHVLVTGASHGIGLELAHALLARGARVTACARTRGGLPESVRFYACDLAKHESRIGLAAAVGELDVLINNAGVQRQVELATAAPFWPSVEEELMLNLHAPIDLTTQLLPSLLARPEAAIVNLTSALAVAPKPSAPVYCASKAALRSFTLSLRRQLAHANVRVIEAIPPVTATAMTGERGQDGWSPAAVAARIVDALEGRTNELRLGKVRLLFAVQRVSPSLALQLMAKN